MITANERVANQLYVIVTCLTPDGDVFDRLDAVYKVRMRLEDDMRREYPDAR